MEFKSNDKKLKSVKRKIKKGFIVVLYYSYGLPIYRFKKDELISNYPRINEEFACKVLMKNGIKISIIN